MICRKVVLDEHSLFWLALIHWKVIKFGERIGGIFSGTSQILSTDTPAQQCAVRQSWCLGFISLLKGHQKAGRWHQPGPSEGCGTGGIGEAVQMHLCVFPQSPRSCWAALHPTPNSTPEMWQDSTSTLHSATQLTRIQSWASFLCWLQQDHRWLSQR